MKKFKLLMLYILIIGLNEFQIPVLIPAMIDLGLKLNLAIIVIYYIDKHYYKEATIGAVIVFISSYFLTSTYLLDPIADIVGLIVFSRVYQHKKSIRTIFTCVIFVVIVSYFAMPSIFVTHEIISDRYWNLITSLTYFRYVMAVYPAFYFLQWTIIVFTIDKLIYKEPNLN